MGASPGPTSNDQFTGDQAALPRVATLVARAAPPGEVVAAVAEEAGRLLGADYATLARYDPDGAMTVVAAWSNAGSASPVGTESSLGGRNVPTLVFQTHRAARIDDYSCGSGPLADAVRELGLHAAVGVPVTVEDALWGVMTVGSRAGPLAASAEEQLARFTELAATAIANAQARVELRGYADEQAALRRVATLVARAAPPGEVLTAVTEEAGRLLHADRAGMARYDRDGAITVVAIWGRAHPAFSAGTRWRLGGQNLHTLIFQTQQPARVDDSGNVSGPVGEAVRQLGIHAAVGVPVSVEGRLWGVMTVGSRAGPLPAETEARLAGFTELAATAIANAQARVELRGFADEQAALRRVATLVARAAAPEDVFAAVTEEAGRLLHADLAGMNRYEPDGAITVVAAWGSTGAVIPIGVRQKLGGQDLHTMVFQTGRPARLDDHAGVSGPLGVAARELGVRAAVGVPVSVEGRLWGMMAVASQAGPLPAGTEARLARFTQLAATAIANAEAQAALSASRARIVATADATRRRFERNLHDGAQQRLVSLALELRAAQAAPPGAGELVQWIDGVAAGLDGVLEDLREIARGLHPASLAHGGLRPALKVLAGRAAIPVSVHVQVDRRLPDPVETAAYYSAAEALTNAAKHAGATAADIEVAQTDGVLHLRVHDDGRGGANLSHGTGLLGLKDRAEALGGHLRLHSPPGAGTTLDITLPLRDPSQQEPPPRATSWQGSQT